MASETVFPKRREQNMRGAWANCRRAAPASNAGNGLPGYSQLALAALCLIWILFRLRHFDAADLLLLIPIAAFVVLAVVHGRLIRRVTAYSRAIRFYEQGVARLEDRWAGTGITGERFLEPSHPCARDLDLFGRASVFELLCTARTRAGEETLARWLLAPASPDEVRRPAAGSTGS